MRKKHHAVGTVLKSNRKVVEKSQNRYLKPQIHDRSLYWLGTVKPLKRGQV